MSIGEQQPNESAALRLATPSDVVAAIGDAFPGLVQSAVVCANVTGGVVSGVVVDADEPGGGYISEWELADGAVYLVLGVTVRSQFSGIAQLDSVGVGDGA